MPPAPHLAMSKQVAWSTVIFAILLIGTCVAAHFYPWLQSVCEVLKYLAGLGLLVAGAVFAFKTTAAAGGGGGGAA